MELENFAEQQQRQQAAPEPTCSVEDPSERWRPLLLIDLTETMVVNQAAGQDRRIAVGLSLMWARAMVTRQLLMAKSMIEALVVRRLKQRQQLRLLMNHNFHLLDLKYEFKLVNIK